MVKISATPCPIAEDERASPWCSRDHQLTGSAGAAGISAMTGGGVAGTTGATPAAAGVSPISTGTGSRRRLGGNRLGRRRRRRVRKKLRLRLPERRLGMAEPEKTRQKSGVFRSEFRFCGHALATRALRQGEAPFSGLQDFAISVYDANHKTISRLFDSLSRMTPEEIFARVLYRDGLILVVDKPPGLAVHRGPKGGENLEDSLSICATACRALRRWRIDSTRTPPAVSCWGAIARRSKSSCCCSSRVKF